MFYEVIPIKIFRQDSGVLTYSSDLQLLPGHIVRIPLGKTFTTGLVLKKVAPVDFPTKPISELLYDTPLPPYLLKSIVWLSDYYLVPLPQIVSLVLPLGVGKKRHRRKLPSSTSPFADSSSPQNRPPIPKSSTIPLNSHQKTALKQLQSIKSTTKLLHGITGSGKTNIYLKLTADTLKKGRSTIILVPEIALTSQLVQIFCSTFNQEITLIHSRQTEAERHRIWHKLLNSDHPEIVIGPRSALFAPLKDLGLIIVDEAHESAYHQENSPKYHALRLASFIASTHKIDCILGSATPSVTDYYLAENKHSLVSLDQKAKTTAISPNIHLVDLKNSQNFGKNRYFSNLFLASIEENLKSGYQTLIFHNRRGSAPLTLCEKCGWQALCPTCFLPLTLHSDKFELACHTCGFSTPLPHSCPDCGHPTIIHRGFGTKLLENELKKVFKNAKIARFDADNKRGESLDLLYDEVRAGMYQIIIGTQTVARGLDLPHLATVGIVQADAGLSLPDYSAEERSFQLINQVIGRVGRGHLDKAEIIIQTYQPDHPIIKYALSNDYQAFYNYLLQKRRNSKLPPYAFLAKISLSYKTESLCVSKIRQIYHLLAQSNLILTPPTPAFHEQNSHGFTWQIIVKSSSRSNLISALQHLPPQLSDRLRVTLDPPSLL